MQIDLMRVGRLRTPDFKLRHYVRVTFVDHYYEVPLSSWHGYALPHRRQPTPTLLLSGGFKAACRSVPLIGASLIVGSH